MGCDVRASFFKAKARCTLAVRTQIQAQQPRDTYLQNLVPVVFTLGIRVRPREDVLVVVLLLQIQQDSHGFHYRKPVGMRSSVVWVEKRGNTAIRVHLEKPILLLLVPAHVDGMRLVLERGIERLDLFEHDRHFLAIGRASSVELNGLHGGSADSRRCQVAVCEGCRRCCCSQSWSDASNHEIRQKDGDQMKSQDGYEALLYCFPRSTASTSTHDRNHACNLDDRGFVLTSANQRASLACTVDSQLCRAVT